MQFIEEIMGLFGGESVKPDFKAVILGSYGGYFECVTGIRHYTPSEIALSFKKGGVIIKGENLYIKKYSSGDVAVCGKINSLERV